MKSKLVVLEEFVGIIFGVSHTYSVGQKVEVIHMSNNGTLFIAHASKHPFQMEMPEATKHFGSKQLFVLKLRNEMTSDWPEYWPDKIVLMYDFRQRSNRLAEGIEFTLDVDYEPEADPQQMLYWCDFDGYDASWVVTKPIISAFFMDISKLSNYDKFRYEMSGKLPRYVDWGAEILEDLDVMDRIVDCTFRLSNGSRIRINDWWVNYYISETKLGHF